jgi:hypothetical protein
VDDDPFHVRLERPARPGPGPEERGPEVRQVAGDLPRVDPELGPRRFALETRQDALQSLLFLLQLGEPASDLGGAVPRSTRCQVKSVPNSEPWSVWIRWMATGRAWRSASTKAIADWMELWS